MNPPPPTPNTTIFSGGNFNLVGSGGSFIVSNVPANISGDTTPPCQITDLQAVLIDKDNEFFLSWTAPGDDYDSGTGKCEHSTFSRKLLIIFLIHDGSFPFPLLLVLFFIF